MKTTTCMFWELFLSRFFWVSAVALASGFVACSGGTSSDPLHILLITLDTARADRFSFNGPSPVETRRLDELAASGTVFRDATAHTPITLPSHASILTGLLPQTHGVRTNGFRSLASSDTTLAEILLGRGFQTAAFVSSPVLSSQYGLDQGFELYDDEIRERRTRDDRFYPERSASDSIDTLLRWLVTIDHSRSSLVWLHLFDPHHPYIPPEPERSRFADSPYDGEIAFVDRSLGRLLDRYDELDLREHLLVVLTADHGEGLGEHGESTHGSLIYQSTVHVPLVFSGVGVPEGLVKHQPVGHVDIVPTILALAKVDTPLPVDGRNLFESRDPPWQAPIYIESLYGELHHGWHALTGVRLGSNKLIRGTFDELFDLSQDPTEHSNLAEKRPADSLDLSRRLQSLIALEEHQQQPPAASVSEADRERLRALGYVTTLSTSAPDDTIRSDPRNQMAVLEKGDRAFTEFSRGNRSEALLMMEEVVSASPGSAFYWELYGSMLASAGLRERALEAFSSSCRLSPNNGGAWKNKGALLAQLGRLDDALSAYTRAQQLVPDDRDLAVRIEKLRATRATRERDTTEPR